jgi:hypothetical protein
MKPMLKALETKPLKLECDETLSTFASKFDLRRYTRETWTSRPWQGGC